MNKKAWALLNLVGLLVASLAAPIQAETAAESRNLFESAGSK